MLTEQNLKTMEMQYNKERLKLAKQVDAATSELLNGRDRMRHDTFKDALAKGAVDPRTSLGVWFRDALAQSPFEK